MDINVFSLRLFLWQLFILVSLVFWIYAITDILKGSFKQNDKLIWFLVVLFVPIVGTVLYLFLGRKQKLKLSL